MIKHVNLTIFLLSLYKSNFFESQTHAKLRFDIQQEKKSVFYVQYLQMTLVFSAPKPNLAKNKSKMKSSMI